MACITQPGDVLSNCVSNYQRLSWGHIPSRLLDFHIIIIIIIIILVLKFIIPCYVYESRHACMWRLADSFVELVLSFYL